MKLTFVMNVATSTLKIVLIMKKINALMLECQNRNFHCSISWQRITDFSIEIYTGYESKYRKIFYTDGHIKLKHAVKEANKFMNQ